MLDKGEELTSPRVIDAAGPAAAVLYHAMYERGGADAVDALPGGQSWREAIEAYPEDERHLAIHAGHLVKANPSDEPHIADLIPFASSMALTGTAEQLPEKIAGTRRAGSHRNRLSASRIRHRAGTHGIRVAAGLDIGADFGG